MADVGSRARWLGYLYAVAALLAGVTQLVPHGSGYDTRGELMVTVMAAIVAVVLVAAHPTSDVVIHMVVVLAALLTTGEIRFTAGLPNAASLFYLWIVLFVFYFFSLRVALIYLALVIALYAASAIWTPAAYPLAANTIGTAGALVGSGFIVGALKRRIEGLIDVLVETSRTDELTDLHNRRAFQDDMARALARANRSGEPLTLAVLDLDRFKEVNDQLGHPGGDDVLRRFAAVLRESVREMDTPARIGGEEFAVLFPAAAAEAATPMAERIRGAVESAFAGERPSVTVSIGLATRPAQADLSSTELMRWADRALYAAKAEGRNRVVSHAAAQAPLPEAAL